MADGENNIGAIKKFLSCLVGKECWSIIAGPGTGSMASLAFGQKIRRSRSIRNPTLSPDQRDFDGEFLLFIKEAHWIVRNADTVICTSNDSNEAAGLMVSGLQQLVGCPLVSASLINGRGDLNLHFENGFNLQLNCQGCGGDAYSMHQLGQTVSVVECAE